VPAGILHDHEIGGADGAAEALPDERPTTGHGHDAHGAPLSPDQFALIALLPRARPTVTVQESEAYVVGSEVLTETVEESNTVLRKHLLDDAHLPAHRTTSP